MRRGVGRGGAVNVRWLRRRCYLLGVLQTCICERHAKNGKAFIWCAAQRVSQRETHSHMCTHARTHTHIHTHIHTHTSHTNTHIEHTCTHTNTRAHRCIVFTTTVQAIWSAIIYLSMLISWGHQNIALRLRCVFAACLLMPMSVKKWSPCLHVLARQMKSTSYRDKSRSQFEEKLPVKIFTKQKSWVL